MKFLGIDFGLKRVGLATSEGNIASPYKIVHVKNFKDALEKIIQEITLGNFDKIVVGLPEGKMGKTVLGFINALKKNNFDVESGDETLSSQEALKQMINLNVPKQKRQFNDDRSAAIILQNYLDSL